MCMLNPSCRQHTVTSPVSGYPHLVDEGGEERELCLLELELDDPLAAAALEILQVPAAVGGAGQHSLLGLRLGDRLRLL